MSFCTFLGTFTLFILATLNCAKAASVLEPYRTDGCSVPAGLSPATWTDCCTAHDFSYWIGGSHIDKHRADAQLISCLSSKGITAQFAAKLFEIIPERFSTTHWGSRWHPRRADQPLTAEELKQVEQYKSSFSLQLPLVKDLGGHKCGNSVIQIVHFTTILPSQDDLTCFDIKKSHELSLASEQLVYSDRCLGYFLVKTNGSPQDSEGIEGYGECANVFRSNIKHTSQKLQSDCKLSQPALKEYFDTLALMKTETRL